MLLLPYWKELLKRIPGLLLLSLFSAGMPYVWMVWRSQQPELTAFYGPISSFKEFWFYFSRKGYAGVDVSPSAGMSDRLEFIQHFFGESLMQVSPVGALLAAFGLYWLLKEKKYGLLAASVWIFLAHSVVLIFLLGFDFEFLNLAVFRPYPCLLYTSPSPRD